VAVASITNALADFATNVIGDLGLPGVFLLMFASSACIPIPSEVTMLFTGFNVSEGEYALIVAILVAVVAELVGSTVTYAIGRRGRDSLLETGRLPRIIRISPEHLAVADRWFEKYGSVAVFFARMIPLVRSFISISAGAAHMQYRRFILLTLGGVVIWDTAGITAGKAARDNWTDIKDKLHYVDYAVVALILLGIGYLVVRRLRTAPDAAV
jgi:membrane protein DedA with SNARE-associated domain